VRSTDNRCCYQTGTVSGFALCLAVVAALSCYAGFSDAAQSAPAQVNSRTAVSGTVLAIDNPGDPISRTDNCSLTDGAWYTEYPTPANTLRR
jgi:hypothetical protein